jgi:polyisoprenoid-binding protein YceI
MKQRISKYLIAIGLSFFLSHAAFAASETFNFDPEHSFVTWHINHFGFSNPSGKVTFKGSLVVDEAKPKDSKTQVTINMADLATGVPKLDEHLKDKDFFNVEKYPTTTFVSNKVDVTGKDQAKVYGVLTLHGVSKPVILDVKLNKVGLGGYTHKKTLGFSATTMIKRSDFGITTYLPGLSDQVKIQIDSEAILG